MPAMVGGEVGVKERATAHAGINGQLRSPWPVTLPQGTALMTRVEPEAITLVTAVTVCTAAAVFTTAQGRGRNGKGKLGFADQDGRVDFVQNSVGKEAAAVIVSSRMCIQNLLFCIEPHRFSNPSLSFQATETRLAYHRQEEVGG